MNGETGFLHSFVSGRWLCDAPWRIEGELAIGRIFVPQTCMR
jgi:hypothetical protein